MKSCFFPLCDNGMGLSCTQWAIAMISAIASEVKLGRKVELGTFSFPYPEGAANLATAAFLELDLDEIVFIDTDILFTPKQMSMLLEHDVPLVSGIYPFKQPGLTFPIIPLPENPGPFANGEVLCEVECVPRGFLRIKREVFEQLKPIVKQYDCPQTGKRHWEFWRNQDGGHSDDFAFCRLYRSIGGRVLVDKRCTTQHIGRVVYPIEGTYAN